MSEEKIEVGEYIRTINGTIAEIEDDEFDLRYGCFGSIQPFYRYFKNKEQITESIVKHSKNIIDLIEVGDYVNGYKVINVINGENAPSGKCVDVDSAMDSSFCTFWEEDIKSIVTKEQFNSVKYTV